MDILNVIFFILLVIVFLSFIFLLIKSKNGRGIAGEIVVREELNKLDKFEYLILNDIHVEKSQIDHIVVSRFGVFVIETKNWSGILYGRGWDRYWDQYVNGKHKKISSPNNPKYQNKAHISSLKEFLHEYPNLPFISIIAVSGSTKRKIYKDPCIKISEVNKKIYSYSELVISAKVRDEIYKKLSQLMESQHFLKN